ncbi:MAG: creatininase family protein [Candidatus Latescibacter sp.]|nr:creatininase family protein [Candidatus Latescibacter sp.]
MSNSQSRRGFLGSLSLTGLAAGSAGAGNAFAGVDAPVRTSPMSPVGNIYIDPRKVLLYECTRKEIRDRLLEGKLKAAIVPTGSTEQHNEHMAMIMDTAGALLVSQQTALKLYPRVIVSTPVPIGVSPHWMNRKGTLTLRKEVFLDVVYDICDSLKTHGITTILIVNGHGGNAAPLNEKVPEFRTKLGINLEWCSYWDSIPADRSKEFVDIGSVPSHAADFETSIALAAFPERVRYQGIDHDKAPLNLNEKDRKWDKDTFEESKLATPEKGEKIIGHAVNWVTEKLLKMMG